MRWLIDGYNVIRRDTELHAHEAESLEAGRVALLRLMARVAARVSDEFTVVFDGARRTGGLPSPGRVQVVFSRPPETADDVLRIPLSEPLFLLGCLFIAVVFFVPGGLASLPARIRQLRRRPGEATS